MKGVNIFLANGFEDIEALGTCDILRRGGVKAQLVGITDEPFVTSSHGITVAVDTTLNELLAGTEEEREHLDGMGISRDREFSQEGMDLSREGMELSQNRELSQDRTEISRNQSLSRHDVMIFPGGMPGAKNLAGCRTLMSEMNAHHAAGGTLAAICAAPGVVLAKLGVDGQCGDGQRGYGQCGDGKHGDGQCGDGQSCLAGAEMTCYDGFEAALRATGATFLPRPAISSEVNGRLIITGRGPGHTQAFAYEILSLLKGAETATQVLQGMNLPVE